MARRKKTTCLLTYSYIIESGSQTLIQKASVSDFAVIIVGQNKNQLEQTADTKGLVIQCLSIQWQTTKQTKKTKKERKKHSNISFTAASLLASLLLREVHLSCPRHCGESHALMKRTRRVRCTERKKRNPDLHGIRNHRDRLGRPLLLSHNQADVTENHSPDVLLSQFKGP